MVGLLHLTKYYTFNLILCRTLCAAIIHLVFIFIKLIQLDMKICHISIQREKSPFNSSYLVLPYNYDSKGKPLVKI